MSLKIRMARGGTKKRPYYRIVIADSRTPRDGRFIEKVGSYNPMVAKDHPDRVKLDDERIKYWLGVGAQPSDRVARFLGAAKLAPKPKIPEQTKQHLPRARTLEKLKESEEKKAAAAEAAAAAPPPVEEAPAEAAPAEDTSAEAAPAESAPAEDKPEEKAAEAQAEDKPAEEAKAGDKPAEEAKAEDKPAEEAKAEDKPAEDKKSEEG